MINNPESLSKQLIDALIKDGWPVKMAEATFERALWPVLDAAMKAGELLVARNTTPAVPVNEALVTWLEGCCRVIALIRKEGHTASRKELLGVISQLGHGAEQALADAKAKKSTFEK